MEGLLGTLDKLVTSFLEISMEKLWLERSDTSKVLPCDHEKEGDDPYWLKVLEEAELHGKKQIYYGFRSVYRGGADFQIYDKLLKHDSLESALADQLASRLTKRGYFSFFNQNILPEAILRTFTEDSEIKSAIRDDLRAATECKPDGKKSYLHCFLNSRGFLACQAYRVAHKLWSLNNKPLAKEIQELASKAFSIDIHPGAKIGSGILIDDYAYGVVIGKKAVIGDNATILGKNFYFYRGNLLAQEINYESLNALTDEESVFMPYDEMCQFVTAEKISFYGIDLDPLFRQKFNNLWPGKGQSGESNEDGGGQFIAIQVDEGDHDSHHSIQLDSSTLKTTKFSLDQSHNQPPSDRFPSYIKIGAEIVQEESEFNLSGLAKTSLLISANLCLSTSALGLVAGKSLPGNARIFLSSAGVSSLAGFLLCSCGYVFQSSRRAKLAARLMTAGGVVAATFAFVLMMGSLFIVMNLFSISYFNFKIV